MKICALTIPLIMLFAMSNCQTRQLESTLNESGTYFMYNGEYQSENGVKFKVKAEDSTLVISTNGVNLYKYSDNWTDERVQKCNSKSIELIEATIENDRKKIAKTFGDSPKEMNEYVEQYLSIHKEVLLADPKPIKYEVENTFYVDEISDHGHE